MHWWYSVLYVLDAVAGFALIGAIVIALPMAFWQQTRRVSAALMRLAGWLVGLYALLSGLTAASAAWGWIAFLACVAFAGIPAVPLGAAALGLHFHQWLEALILVGWGTAWVFLIALARVVGECDERKAFDETITDQLRKAGKLS